MRPTYYPVKRYHLPNESLKSDMIFIPNELYNSFVIDCQNDCIFVTVKGMGSQKIVPAFVEGPIAGDVVYMSSNFLEDVEYVSVLLVNLKEVTYMKFKALNQECVGISDVTKALQTTLKFTTTFYLNQKFDFKVPIEKDGIKTTGTASVEIIELKPNGMVYVSHLRKDIQTDFINSFVSSVTASVSSGEDDKRKGNEDIISTKKEVVQKETVNIFDRQSEEGKEQCAFCGSWVAEEKIKIHESQCKKIYMKCQTCQQIIKIKDYNEHMSCHKRVFCPQCDIICEVCSLQRHLNGSCGKKVIECGVCGLAMFQSEQEKHNESCEKTLKEVAVEIRNGIVREIGEIPESKQFVVDINDYPLFGMNCQKGFPNLNRSTRRVPNQRLLTDYAFENFEKIDMGYDEDEDDYEKFWCGLCGKSFRTSKELERHDWENHGGLQNLPGSLN